MMLEGKIWTEVTRAVPLRGVFKAPDQLKSRQQFHCQKIKAIYKQSRK